MPLTRTEYDDARMAGKAQAAEMREKAKQEFNAPAMAARNAAGWHQLLQAIAAQMGPGVTPQMIEQMLKQQSPQRYEEAKKRFIAGGANGKTQG